jgi:N utilization substance protein B
LVIGCTEKREVIDEAIRAVSQNWRLERMAYVDRNIIRLAVYELLMLSDIPRNVTLNEAVELAKLFGDESSPSFINGVLDRIAFNLGKE